MVIPLFFYFLAADDDIQVISNSELGDIQIDNLNPFQFGESVYKVWSICKCKEVADTDFGILGLKHAQH